MVPAESGCRDSTRSRKALVTRCPRCERAARVRGGFTPQPKGIGDLPKLVVLKIAEATVGFKPAAERHW